MIEGLVKRIWKNLIFHKVEMIGKRVFLVRLQTVEERDAVCDMNRVMFDKTPLDSSVSKDSLKTVPLWIKMPNLEVNCLGDKSLGLMQAWSNRFKGPVELFQ